MEWSYRLKMMKFRRCPLSAYGECRRVRPTQRSP
ncbi:uncharacterized protein G2W53_013998 [Senna tora]|uniref:Uncharacterized protein n=1 Tax=Senna tora TaxID=362788 RepID=A0A834WPW9_9FABA|nr:uncharacterized protein G2W53_013998 [Senna tora]